MNESSADVRPVHRLRPLPRAPSRGRLIVVEAVVPQTAAGLQAFRGPDGSHEGIVLWAGHRLKDATAVCSCVVPDAEHTWGSVRIDYSAVGDAARAARAGGLAIVAQVHSHPGTDTRHSDGDDDMVLLPFEGMFSLVVASYGTGSILPWEGAGLHQFQDGRWVHIENPADALVIVPAVLPR
jgi:proteasome lid subunit RPN8/RPN11